jgi:hypothetical protein
MKNDSRPRRPKDVGAPKPGKRLAGSRTGQPKRVVEVRSIEQIVSVLNFGRG